MTVRRTAFLRERDELTLLAVHAQPGATTRELAGELALSQAQTYLSLRRLLGLGEVQRAETWPATWVITPIDAVFEDFDDASSEPYPGAHELVHVRRVDLSQCVHLLEGLERTGVTGAPTRELISRIKTAMELTQ